FSRQGTQLPGALPQVPPPSIPSTREPAAAVAVTRPVQERPAVPKRSETSTAPLSSVPAREQPAQSVNSSRLGASPPSDIPLTGETPTAQIQNTPVTVRVGSDI